MSNEIPYAEKPQVKLEYFGPKALTDAELLSLIVGSGTKNSLELADSVISYVSDNTGSLGLTCAHELSNVNGIGEAKAASIAAAMELGRREAVKRPTKRTINCSSDIAELMRLSYAVPGETREHFVSYLLNSKCQIISQHLVSIGTIDQTMVHPREVFAPAVKNGAAAVVVAHNHPSGDPTPSAVDLEVTRRLISASEVLGIKLFDHVVVGDYDYTSIKGEELIPEWI